MKTTWDAVNGLQGDLNNSSNCYYGGEDSLFYCDLRGEFGLSYSPHDKGSRYDNVCSVKEFNALVTEMSLGLDVNPINEGYYHKYLDADKEELEPIKQKPIYTQEMYDNGELPPIGSLFIDVELSDDEQVEAMAHDLELGRVIYKRGSTLQDSEYFGAQAHECKPIPSKLELIDGKAYQFDCTQSDNATNDIQGIFVSSASIFLTKDGSFCASSCTNIKPLTVKGE